MRTHTKAERLLGWVREWVDEAFQPTFLVSAALAAVLFLGFVPGLLEEKV